MKLTAWQDNPGQRGKDIEDFEYILYHYFTITADEIFANKEEDWFAEPYDERVTGARFLGWQMKKIFVNNDHLKSIIITALTRQLDTFSKDDIDKMFQNNKNDFKIIGYKLITEVIESINKD